MIPICCGTGEQTLKWLASVAIARWDGKNGKGFLTLGVPKTVRNDEKQELEMTAIICQVLENNDHVFIEASRDQLIS